MRGRNGNNNPISSHSLQVRAGSVGSDFMSNRSTTPRNTDKSLELRVLQSYISVLRVKTNADGYRASSLERHGAYEVRLIDQPEMARNDTAPFWLELFDHATKHTLDSYGSYDLEASAIAADAFIAQAKFLQQTQARTCKLERPDVVYGLINPGGQHQAGVRPPCSPPDIP
jgi:hypothetical protein